MDATLTAHQIKVTLPTPLFSYLREHAERLGLTLSGYIKNLIIDEVKSQPFPSFKMSRNTEKVAQEALTDYRLGRTKKLNNIEELMLDL